MIDLVFAEKTIENRDKTIAAREEFKNWGEKLFRLKEPP